MGLDIVEALLEIESELGIDLDDDDLENMVYVGELYNLVLTAIRKQSPVLGSRHLAFGHGYGPRSTATVFYRLRQELCRKLRLERRAIRPTTKLLELAPPSRMDPLLRRIAELTGWRMPTRAGCRGHLATMGDLVLEVLRSNHALVAHSANGFNEREVWEHVVARISEHCCVPREKLTATTPFTDFC